MNKIAAKDFVASPDTGIADHLLRLIASYFAKSENAQKILGVTL
jgi:hypothetical protein